MSGFSTSILKGSWVPAISFTTPGDLAVTYAGFRVGEYSLRDGLWCTLTFNIQTSVFTWTTSSGSLVITGSPFTPKTLTNMEWAGALSRFQGFSKANYTQFTVALLSANSNIFILGAAQAQNAALIDTAAAPSASQKLLCGSIEFPIA